MDLKNLESVYAHLRRLEARACVGASPPDFVMWISALGVPTELVELFATCWPQSQIDVVPFQLFEPAQLRKDPDLPRLLAHRLLVLGCCPSGDPLVLDLATDAWVPGAVEHGLLWGDEPEDADPRSRFPKRQRLRPAPKPKSRVARSPRNLRIPLRTRSLPSAFVARPRSQAI